MHKKYTAYGTTIHTFEFDPEVYSWTIEIGKPGVLEALQQIAPNADYVMNWSVFDWSTGKNGYGRIQNGKSIIQGSSPDFPTISFVDGKLREGEYPDARPGFARWRIVVRDGKIVCDYVADGNHNAKDARSAIGQKGNGNIVFITVEGDDTKKQGMTAQELGLFALSLGCTFCCDCDGGGSVACRSKYGYIYEQGRAVAGAMVVEKKTLLNMCMTKIGCGYAWATQGETLTEQLLRSLVQQWGEGKYYFDGYSAEKWLGKQCFDCSGLIVWAGNKLGIIRGDYTAEGLYAMCDKVSQPQPGDLCFNRNLTHVGIYVGSGQYLHAKGTKYGVMVTDQYTFVKFGRLRMLNNTVSEEWQSKAVEFVTAFQQKTGITIDGMAGKNTYAKLEELTQEKQARYKVYEKCMTCMNRNSPQCLECDGEKCYKPYDETLMI